jgi:hypothetical protein
MGRGEGLAARRDLRSEGKAVSYSYTHHFEVGKFYRVPCVWINEFWGAKNIWIPVIGPMHEDADLINFKPRHWHIDWRFAPKRVVPTFPGQIYGTVLCKDLRGDAIAETKGPELKLRKMQREWPTYPFKQVESVWLPKLREAFKGHRLKGMVCPHRGIPLQGCPQDGDVVTCPGHGLRWNIKTGELVPSPCATPSPTSTEERHG